MKKLVFLFAAAVLASCSNSTNNDTRTDNDSTRSVLDTAATDTSVVLFNVTDAEALKLVSKVPEADKELKRTFADTTTRTVLIVYQEANSDDPNHYLQLVELHNGKPTSILAHFRVDAMSGEIRVMNPLGEEETWITLDKWRQIKI